MILAMYWLSFSSVLKFTRKLQSPISCHSISVGAKQPAFMVGVSLFHDKSDTLNYPDPQLSSFCCSFTGVSCESASAYPD